MLGPEIARRLDRLLAGHAQGLFTEEEFAEYLGHLVTAETLCGAGPALPGLLAAVSA